MALTKVIILFVIVAAAKGGVANNSPQATSIAHGTGGFDPVHVCLSEWLLIANLFVILRTMIYYVLALAYVRCNEELYPPTSCEIISIIFVISFCVFSTDNCAILSAMYGDIFLTKQCGSVLLCPYSTCTVLCGHFRFPQRVSLTL